MLEKRKHFLLEYCSYTVIIFRFVNSEEETKLVIPSKTISRTEFKAIKEQENEKLQAAIAGNVCLYFTF